MSEFIDGINERHFILITNRSAGISWPTTEAYDTKRPINVEKLNDVKKTCQYVPDEFKQFYNDLLTWPTKKDKKRN